MDTRQVLEQMLERDWTEADLRLAAQILEEAERSSETTEAIRDCDRLRSILKNPSPDAAPSRGWQEFEARLLAMTASSESKPLPTREPQRPAPRPARMQAVALASSLVLAAVGWLLYLNRPEPAPAPPLQPAATFAGMTPSEVNQQVGLFGHMTEVFDARAKWVAVSNGSADLGLASAPLPAKHKLILLRLAVLRGGKLLSRSDLAIVPGQEADMTFPFEDGQKLRYRINASTAEPTRLSLWVELQKPGSANQTLAALATELAAHSGDLIKTGELSTSSGQYQFQVGVFEAQQQMESQP